MVESESRTAGWIVRGRLILVAGMLCAGLAACSGPERTVIRTSPGPDSVGPPVTDSATSAVSIPPATETVVARVDEPEDLPPGDSLSAKASGLSREQRSAVMRAYTKSLIYSNYQDAEKVLESLDEIVQAAPNFAYGYVLKGQQLRAMGRIEDASAAAVRAAELDPNESGAFYLLAQLAGRQGDAAREREYLEKAVSTGASGVEARRDLARALARDRNYEAAVALFEQLIRDDPALAPEYSYQAGYCLSRLGRHPEALEHFLALLQYRPDNRPTALEIGRCYREMGDLSKARYYFERAAVQPDGTGIADAYSRIAFQNLGEMAYEQENWQEAADYIQQALRLDPGYNTGRKLLGILLFRSDPSDAQLAEKASVFIESYLQSEPDDPEAQRYLAYIYATMGEAGKAYDLAQKIEDPAVLPEVRLVIGRYLIARGREDEGLRLVRSVREAGGFEEIEYSDALWSLAYLEAAEGRVDGARDYIERIRPEARRAAAYAYMSSRLLAGRHFDAAYAILDTAQTRAGSDPVLLASIGDVWTEVVRYDRAERAYQTALDATPANTAILLRMASLYDRMDAIEKADAIHQRLTDLEPDNALYAQLWGRFYLKRKQAPVTAIRHFERAVFIDPDDEDAHYLLAVARKDFEGVEAGERILVRFLEAHPGSRLAYDALGNFYLANDEREGRFQRALEMYNLALGSEIGRDVLPDRALQGQKARALEGLGDVAAAESIFLALHEAEPDSLGALLTLASFHIRQKTRLEDMEALLLERLDNELLGERARRDIHFTLALLYDAMKRYDQAHEIAARILEDDPFNAAGSNLLGYMYAEQGIRLDEAERLIQLALKKEPYSGAYLDSYGWVLYQRGEYEKALHCLLRASQLEGPDPVIYDHLGDCYARLGRWTEALHYYERGLRTDPRLEGIAQKIEQARAAVRTGT